MEKERSKDRIEERDRSKRGSEEEGDPHKHTKPSIM